MLHRVSQGNTENREVDLLKTGSEKI